MKKHLFRIGLVVTMLLGLMMISANAAPAANCTVGNHTEDGTWQKLTSSTTITASGNYYLEDAEVAFANGLNINGAYDVTICLNGNTLKFNGRSGSGATSNFGLRVQGGATVSICDCSTGEAGKITSDNATGKKINPIHIDKDSTVNLFGGSITGNTIGANAAAVFLYNNTAVFNMHGGTIKNNTYAGGTKRGAIASTSGGDINIFGGEIKENYDKAGTEYACSTACAIVIKGGTVYGQIVPGSYGANITGGTFNNDPSDYVTEAGLTVTEADGIYTVGKAAGGDSLHGDGLAWTKYVPGETTITGGGCYYLDQDREAGTIAITEGTVTFCLHDHTISSTVTGDADPANAFTVAEGATLILQDCDGEDENSTCDGTIKPKEATANSRGIRVAGTLEMKGGTITGFTISTYSSTNNGDGAGVYLPTSGMFTMSGGKITDNTARGGGGVRVGGTMVLSGGEISGNVATALAGGIYVNAGKFTMNSGFVSGNTAGTTGGGIDSVSATVTVNGGEICNNTAGGAGGGIRLNNKTTGKMTGGYIYGNESGGAGPGVYAYGSGTATGSTFEMTGGSIGLDSSDVAKPNCQVEEGVAVKAEGSTIRANAYSPATVSSGKFYSEQSTSDDVFGGSVTVSAAQMNKKPGTGFLAENCMAYRVSDNGETLIYEVAKKFAPAKVAVQVGSDMKLKFTVTKAEIPGDYKTDYEVVFSDGQSMSMENNATKTARFFYYFAAKDMADTFTVTIKNGESKVFEADYSVKEFIDGSLSTSAGGSMLTGQEMTAVKYLAKYGAAAQEYFNYKDNGLVTDGLTADLTTETLWNKDALVEADMFDLALDENKWYKGSSLSLKDQVVLNLYFTSDVTKVTVGGEEYTPVNGVVSIRPSLKNAAEKLTIIMTDGTNSYTIYDSIQAYAYRAQHLADPNTLLANLCQAMMDFVLSARNT